MIVFTGFYGFAYTSDRNKLWDLLQPLNGYASHPWVLFGDFNEVLLVSEKEGGRELSTAQMQGFRDVLDQCLLNIIEKLNIFLKRNSNSKRNGSQFHI